MCFNELKERSLLPECRIANRVHLFSLLQSLQEQQLRPEDVDVQLRDRYDVFRQVLPNYPLPELENSLLHSVSVSVDSESSGDGTSDTSLESN
ncbi:uncharacterized protein LOC108101162 [Drosophila ficusphila]|uniref:uncharacterized protein LOC108101162 n=1 Tax=Drosophila ficusphila TaxID=30025 RepID=UPI001C8A6105|nr:uncharacterized protein LOC108101162 [Drosophila ficusphila]